VVNWVDVWLGVVGLGVGWEWIWVGVGLGIRLWGEGRT
jgi:hypothetical protein